MWELTTIARTFFEDHLPWWQMQSANELLSNKEAYCLAKPTEVYAIYIPNGKTTTLDLNKESGEWTVHWFDPIKGKTLQVGNAPSSNASESFGLGDPPNMDQDWVALVRRVSDAANSRQPE